VSEAASPVLELRAVGVRVGDRWLLDDVSLTVAAGEVVALIGPNGAGKSTLLRVAAGELSPPAGAVLLDGRALGAVAPGQLARRRATLAQDTQVDFPIEAIEVVRLGRLPHGDGERESLAGSRRAMARTGTTHLAERLLPTLSGGERQRVQAARSLAQLEQAPGRPLLLLDEPVAALDPHHQHRLLALARDEARRGVAVLCALHDLNLAARYADRIVALRDGRCLAAGPPADVLTPALLADLFAIEAEVITLPSHPWPLVVTRGPTPTRTTP
jgi:iron complex transport system ATP-binding protein